MIICPFEIASFNDNKMFTKFEVNSFYSFWENGSYKKRLTDADANADIGHDNVSTFFLRKVELKKNKVIQSIQPSLTPKASINWK
jgi:hypothetical protein